MRRTLAFAAVLALTVAIPATVEGAKAPLKITLKSWQVVVNDAGDPIPVANKGTFRYCPDDGVTHIYAIGKANTTKKGKTFSITWKLDGAKLVTLDGYKTKKNGFVLAALHRKTGPFDDGTYTAVRKNGTKKSSVKITLKADPAAC
jgi:hypothetical protein